MVAYGEHVISVRKGDGTNMRCCMFVLFAGTSDVEFSEAPSPEVPEEPEQQQQQQ
jgi:hypothetical protein